MSPEQVARRGANNLMKNTSQNVDVLINGKPVKVYAHEGRLFIEAKDGSEYTIKVRNDSFSRVLAVASVDGLNVVSGKTATDDGAGYIVSGRSAYEIKGFRVSNDVVNAFAFGKKDKSYAAKSEETDGDTRNCGVIGVKFYTEKVKPRPEVIYRDRVIDRPIPYPVPEPYYPRPWRPHPWGDPIWCISDSTGDTTKDSATFTCSAASLGGDRSMRSASLNAPLTKGRSRAGGQSAGEFDMGTVFTKKEVEDKVRTVEFERGSLEEFVEIFYASREELESMGVPLTKETKVAFPSSFQSSGYCKKPRE